MNTTELKEQPTNILTFTSAIKEAPEHPSIWGHAIKSFKQDIEKKAARDIISLVLQLKSQIRDNERAMEEILGTKFFNYIKNFHV